VVDATTRMLHWLMALSFTAAYITADGERWRLVHVTLGYTLAGLVVARVLWGLFGRAKCACRCCGASCRGCRHG
jgi:Cytochrome b(N-terminal)/b6/petB.